MIFYTASGVAHHLAVSHFFNGISPTSVPFGDPKGTEKAPPLPIARAWRRTTSAASLLRKHALAVDCPAGAIIVRSPVSLRSTVAPRAQPRTASKQRQFSLALSFVGKRKNNLPGGCRYSFTSNLNPPEYPFVHPTPAWRCGESARASYRVPDR